MPQDCLNQVTPEPAFESSAAPCAARLKIPGVKLRVCRSGVRVPRRLRDDWIDFRREPQFSRPAGSRTRAGTTRGCAPDYSQPCRKICGTSLRRRANPDKPGACCVSACSVSADRMKRKLSLAPGCS